MHRYAQFFIYMHIYTYARYKTVKHLTNANANAFMGFLWFRLKFMLKNSCACICNYLHKTVK